jgi:rhodanese-related sulfurtransferase
LRSRNSTAPPDYQWLVDIGDAALVDLVAAVPDASVIQLAHLGQVEHVRLADLAGFPHLRSIRVLDVRQKAEYADPAVPPGLPVEQVHLVAKRFDPHRLAATPTIAYLTLGGNTEPVAVAALAGLPHLVRLDLAEAAVADIGSIATFPALRVLSLNPQQWDELLRTGGRRAGWLPPNSADMQASPRRPRGCPRSAAPIIRQYGTAQSGTALTTEPT